MTKESDQKRFHNVDSRWELFGCPDYDSYLNRYLVEGRFHDKVPKSVVDAYTTIEYLMAHAYYFYPIYDEALSKLLKVMEMATKLRCKELGIDLIDRSKSNSKRTQQHKFAFLIDKIDKAEPEKRLGNVLHWSRHIRNFSMHPDANSYSGGMSNPACISCVNTLNLLFAPTGFFSGYIDEFEKINQQFAIINTKPIVLNYKSERILVHKIELVDLFLDGQTKLYCLCADTALDSLEPEGEEDFRFGHTFTMYLNQLEFVNENVIGKQLNDGESIIFESSDHPLNLSRYNAYKTYINAAVFANFNQYEAIQENNRSSAKAKFRYNLYHTFEFKPY